MPAEIPIDDLDDEKELNKRHSMISPNLSDIGAQSPSNEHIDCLAGILLTYNFYEKDLGMSESPSVLVLCVHFCYPQVMFRGCQISAHRYTW